MLQFLGRFTLANVTLTSGEKAIVNTAMQRSFYDAVQSVEPQDLWQPGVQRWDRPVPSMPQLFLTRQLVRWRRRCFGTIHEAEADEWEGRSATFDLNEAADKFMPPTGRRRPTNAERLKSLRQRTEGKFYLKSLVYDPLCIIIVYSGVYCRGGTSRRVGFRVE